MKAPTANQAETILASLPAGEPVAVVRDGPATLVARDADRVVRAGGTEALEALDDLEPGWWAGFLAYDLGRSIERVPDMRADDAGIPDVLLARFRSLTPLDGRAAVPVPAVTEPAGGWTSSLDRPAWDAAVGRIHAHLLAGDCYQVNLTRRMEHPRALDPVALFGRLRAGNPAPHEALVRIEDVAVVSASPERFLRRDGLHIETRPIKGTHRDPAVLAASQKDRAENVMITDLARNDLGRLCEYGSVHVAGLCEPEQHPGLYHLVSTVRGRLCAGVTVGEIVRATFPPASVTGCPKPRVLEIIETLEPVRRGVYCGAVGFIDTTRDVIDLNVAIRTFTITGGMTLFGVGGAIVADSDAGAEWEETELKARRLLPLASGP